MGKFVIVDCEADGPCPGLGNLTEFGAVYYHDTTKRFHGKVQPVWPDKSSYEEARIARRWDDASPADKVMADFALWTKEVTGGDRPIFVSDNPAFDWMWINYYFHHYYGSNPYGWSARRIGDIWAGVVGDLRRPWKHLRDTVHDHNPVNDALGNAEALKKILSLVDERKKQ